jgi:hypothetical protein
VGEREGGYWLLARARPNIVYSSFTSGEHSGVGLLRGITKAKQRLSFFLVFWLDNDLSVLANCTSHLSLSLSLSLSLHLSSETGILSFLFCRKKIILKHKNKETFNSMSNLQWLGLWIKEVYFMF